MGGRLAQTVRAGRVGVVTGLFHGVLEEVASGDGALVGVCSFAKEDDGVVGVHRKGAGADAFLAHLCARGICLYLYLYIDRQTDRQTDR